MNYIILASHGELSKGMHDSLKMLVGDVKDKVRYLSLKVGENATEMFSDLAKLVKEDINKKYILVTDLFGGSVNTAAMELFENSDNLFLVSGMNLGLVLELYLMSEDADENTIQKRIDESSSKIMLLTRSETVTVDEEDF